MRQFLAILFVFTWFTPSFSQVYINVDEADQVSSADLQIDSENSGVALPHVLLNSINSYAPIATEPKAGLIVYNPNLTRDIDPGYYYWSNSTSPSRWVKIGGIEEKGTIIQNVDIDFLGYNPTGVAASTPATFSIGTKTATRQRCAKWETSLGGNGHVYCAYTINNTINFNEAVTAARDRNGYIVSIVSDSEWTFVKNNVIQDGLSLGGSTLDNNIWLSYVKLATPGNSFKYYWMTGETWENNWSNNATTQSYFATNQPEESSANNTTR